MAAFRLGTVNPQERHTSDTQLSSKMVVVSAVESKVSADRPLVVGILECLPRTTIWGSLECFFQCPALRAAFSGDNSADRFLFLN